MWHIVKLEEVNPHLGLKATRKNVNWMPSEVHL